MEMERYSFKSGGARLSYLDTANGRPPLVTLHAHWMEGATFRRLSADLAADWRVVALDQRGHGYSDHAATYRREDYVSDILALFDYLELEDAVVLGNSLGGANTYQFAARHPDRVTAIIIEDCPSSKHLGLAGS